MIRFVDLRNGSTYNGESPYMHYPFGSDGLSCGIPIVGKLCFLSDQSTVDVTLDENPVYSLLDPGAFETAPDETINEFQYKNLEGLKADALVPQGVPLDDMYIYMVYILGNADEAGEWTCDIVIDDTAYAFSGDWYEEDERLWINASNMGFEVPDQIQKTFYQTNVHEDLKDPMILNRKYKEVAVLVRMGRSGTPRGAVEEIRPGPGELLVAGSERTPDRGVQEDPLRYCQEHIHSAILRKNTPN